MAPSAAQLLFLGAVCLLVASVSAQNGTTIEINVSLYLRHNAWHCSAFQGCSLS